jgi:hypothetical protein
VLIGAVIAVLLIGGITAFVLPWGHPQATGILSLRVSPRGAVLTLDGQPWGSAADFRREVPAGSHELEISADGYQSQRETVTVPAGGQESLQIALSRLPRPTTGVLWLLASPPEAVLTLDGQPAGSASYFRRKVPAGPHELEISADGYQSQRETVTVPAGGQESVEFPLLPLVPDLGGVVQSIAGASRFKVAGQWIKLWGIDDPTGHGEHITAVYNYLKLYNGMVRCYRKREDRYRCYAGQQDLAILALQRQLAHPTSDAPPEYRDLVLSRSATGASLAPRLRQAFRDELDKILRSKGELEKFPLGKSYLHAPITMKVGDRRVVDLRVGYNVADDLLKGNPRPEAGQSDSRSGDHDTSWPAGQTSEGAPRLAHTMLATLVGPGFEITPISPKEQTIAEGFPSIWEWVIKAKEKGPQLLEATLYAVLPDVGERYYIDSFEQNVIVKVKELTWSEWVKSMGQEIDAVKAIILSVGTVVAVIFGWFEIFRRRRRTRMRASLSGSKRQSVKVSGRGGTGRART